MLARIRQEPIELDCNGRAWPLRCWRRETREIDARRNDLHAVRLVVVVKLVLLANLLVRTGDHQGGRLHGPFLRFDSLGEVIRLLAGFALGLEP